MAGPAMVAISKALEFHVIVLLNTPAGTSCGTMAERAGQPRIRITPITSRMTYTTGKAGWVKSSEAGSAFCSKSSASRRSPPLSESSTASRGTDS